MNPPLSSPLDHQKFQALLSTIPANEDPFVYLSSQLNNNIFEVKIHAHKYLMALLSYSEPSASNAPDKKGPTPSSPITSVWSTEEDREFERLLAAYPEGTTNRWAVIAADLNRKLGHAYPGSPVDDTMEGAKNAGCWKTKDDVRSNYEKLVKDVYRINCGVPLTP